MKNKVFGGARTLFISAAIISVIVSIGLITFGMASKFEEERLVAGFSGQGNIDPNGLPAPAAGVQGQGGGHLPVCEGVVFRASDNGIRYVRESGGGVYYAAEVKSLFGIYTLDYGYLVKVEDSRLDTHTYRKLKHALYHCEGPYIKTGLHIPAGIPDNTQA